VDRAEIDLDPEVDPYSAEVYAKAKENFLKLQSGGVLVREPKPCMYLVPPDHRRSQPDGPRHRLPHGGLREGHHQEAREDPPGQGGRPHAPRGHADANTGPIFLTYRQRPAIAALIQGVLDNEKPVYDINAPDGVRHQVWRVGYRHVRLADLPV
jgi:uncharacterized protein (DUF1015 family)